MIELQSFDIFYSGFDGYYISADNIKFTDILPYIKAIHKQNANAVLQELNTTNFYTTSYISNIYYLVPTFGNTNKEVIQL